MKSYWKKWFIFFISIMVVNNANSMTFSVVKFKDIGEALLWENEHPSADGIYAEGEITDATPQDFREFIRTENIRDAVVLFNSPGGSLFAGMKLGSAIRDLGFDTGIASYTQGSLLSGQAICASACAYAFAGGVARYYGISSHFNGGKNPRLGIHQFYSLQNNLSGKTSQEVSGVIVAYLQKMGVDAMAFAASTTVGGGDILWLTPADAEKLRFANNGSYPTTAELKLINGSTTPYLRVEQDHIRYAARFLLVCSDKKQILLEGGLVYSPQEARETYNWATQSFFTFDKDEIQPYRKPLGLSVKGSVVFVTRLLSGDDVKKLLASEEITVWVAADGAVGKTGEANINGVKDKISGFINDCSS